MSTTLTTNFRKCNFNTTLLTNNTTVFHTLILAADTLVIFYWSENFCTEKAIALRLERTIVNSFWLLHFAK